MTPKEMDEITEIERAEIMSEIEARHAPKFHGIHPCPSGGCCSCGAVGGCDTGIALNSLAAANQRAEAAEPRAAALDARVRELDKALDLSKMRYGVDGVPCWCPPALPNDWHTQRCRELRALAASGGAAPAERAGHEYEGACRNVQHAATGACACNALVNGRLCRLSRINPIHEREQPPAGQEGRG